MLIKVLNKHEMFMIMMMIISLGIKIKLTLMFDFSVLFFLRVLDFFQSYKMVLSSHYSLE